MRISVVEGYDHLPRGAIGTIATGYGLSKLQHNWAVAGGSYVTPGVMVDPVGGKPAGYVQVNKNTTSNIASGCLQMNPQLLMDYQMNYQDGFTISFKLRNSAVTGNSTWQSLFTFRCNNVNQIQIKTLPNAPVPHTKYYQIEIVIGQGMRPNYDVYMDKVKIQSGVFTQNIILTPLIIMGPTNATANNLLYSQTIYFKDFIIAQCNQFETAIPLGRTEVIGYVPSTAYTLDEVTATWFRKAPTNQSLVQILGTLPIGSNASNGNSYVGLWCDTMSGSVAGPYNYLVCSYTGFQKDKAILAVWPVTQGRKSTTGNYSLSSWLRDTRIENSRVAQGSMILPQSTFNLDSNNSPTELNWSNNPWTYDDLLHTEFFLSKETRPLSNPGWIDINHATLYVVYADIRVPNTGKTGLESLKDLINQVSNPDAAPLVTFGSPTTEVRPDINNTSVTLTTLPDANYRGSTVVYYQRIDLVAAMPFGVTLPANVTTSHQMIPILNQTLGVKLDESDLVLTSRSGNTLLLQAATTSYWLVPGTQFIVST